MKLIKKINDEIVIEVGKGKFDDHCVYINNNSSRYAPRDVDYFSFFINMKNKYSSERIYEDFIKIYNHTNEEISSGTLSLVTDLSNNYEEMAEFDKWFTVIYLGMVAEEKKQNAILKKKIKRLGIHQILFEGLSALDAANYSKGKKAHFLLKECSLRGF